MLTPAGTLSSGMVAPCTGDIGTSVSRAITLPDDSASMAGGAGGTTGAAGGRGGGAAFFFTTGFGLGRARGTGLALG